MDVAQQIGGGETTVEARCSLVNTAEYEYFSKLARSERG